MLKNLELANRTIITIYGRLEFDENGITYDLDRFQAEKLAKLKGYELVEESIQDEPEEELKEEEEIKEEESKEEEEPKEEPLKNENKYTKSQLRNMTVEEIEKVAKKEYGIKLEVGVKKEKIEQVLMIQEQEG